MIPYIIYNYKINTIINNDKNTNYILISDSSIIANKLKENIESIHYWDSCKIHLGDLKNYTNTNILDTLIDFFIMSSSVEIISNWSGFSKVISEIYDIKYTII
jgi:hypothetical protein